MSSTSEEVQQLVDREYRHGFVTDIESDTLPPGLNEDVIRHISSLKNEPEFMLEWRLKAYRYWAKLEKSQAEPKWDMVCESGHGCDPIPLTREILTLLQKTDLRCEDMPPLSAEDQEKLAALQQMMQAQN